MRFINGIRSYKRKIIAICCVLTTVMCMMAGCGKKGNKDEATKTDAIANSTVVMKVGEVEITKEEALVYSLLQLLSGQFKYINVLADEPMIEDMTIDEIRNTKILSAEATRQGFELNDDDMEVVNDLIGRFTGYVTDEVLEQYDISKETVEKVFRETSLVDKFENDTKNELGKTLTAEAEDSYKDYNFQKLVYMIFPIVEEDENGEPKTDESGKTISLSEEEKAAIKEKAENVVKEINDGTDYETVAKKYEITEMCQEQTGYVGAYSDELNEKLGSMKVGQCTDIKESEVCYYSIVLVSDHDEDIKKEYAYATAKAQVDEQYEKMKDGWLAQVPFQDSDIIDNFWSKFDLAEVATTLFEKQLMN